MPELPEVESGRRLAEKYLAGKEIHHVEVTPGGDHLVFCNSSIEAISDALLHRKILRCCRRGKHIWFELNRDPYVAFHFGMTGAFLVKTETSLIRRPSYGSITQKNGDWPPRFWKLQLKMNDGTHFAFVNSRRFGRVRFFNQSKKEDPFSGLGFDPLLDTLSAFEFSKRFNGKECSIKSALLDQSICAGIGNWIADETLYQAGIHPANICGVIDNAGWKSMKTALEQVVLVACDHDADSKFFPNTWLFHYRWARNKTTRLTAVDFNGNPIHFSSIGGRTTAYVPVIQKLYKSECHTAEAVLCKITSEIKENKNSSNFCCQRNLAINPMTDVFEVKKQFLRKKKASTAYPTRRSPRLLKNSRIQ